MIKFILKKHVESHADEAPKFCHYFNNGKKCPFEHIGCMFLHQDSERCYFGVDCRNKLCQFKHIEQINDDYDGLDEKFNELTESERAETKEVFCDLYCNRDYDCHRCTEDGFESYIGCDVLNITNDNEEEVSFPCNKCDDRFDTNEKLKAHFSRNHTPDKFLKCSLDECNFSTMTINMMVMHIGVNHIDCVRR